MGTNAQGSSGTDWLGRNLDTMSEDEKRALNFPKYWGGWMGFQGPQADLVAKSATTGDKLTTQGTGLLNSSISAMDKSTDFFSKLLGGDSDALMRTVQPQVDTILHQYDTAKRSAAEFAPRGGGRNAAMQDADFAEAGDISKLIGGAAPMAADKLRDIAAQFGYIGLGASGQGENATQDAMKNIFQQQGLYLQSQGQGFNQSMQIGQGIGSLAAMLAMLL